MKKEKFKSNQQKLSDIPYDMIIWIDDFFNGLAWFRVCDPMYQVLYGFINRRYTIKIRPVFQKVKEFSGGLAPFLVDKSWGFINKKGLQVIEPAFYDVTDGFKSGLCAVRRNNEGKFGYINKKGILKLPPVYDLAFSFYQGRAKIAMDGAFYFINKRGKIISKALCPYKGI